MLQNNYIALVITFVLAFTWLRLMDFFAHKGWIESKLSRKIIHIGTGPLFVLCWLLFDTDPNNRFLAMLVPLASTIQFGLIGAGILKDEASVKAMSRSGDRREILKGPLIYGIVFVVLTILFWKDSLLAIIPLMVLCGGDGLADIVGKRFSKTKIAWSQNKTWAGTLGMIVGSMLLNIIVIWIFQLVGFFPIPWNILLPKLLLISVVSALVETLPIKDFDNITVPLSAVLLSMLLF